jgi:hypothetical protein
VSRFQIPFAGVRHCIISTMNTPDDLASLVAAVREGLERIQELLGDLARTVGANERRQAEQSGHIAKVAAEIRFPEAIERERTAEQKKQHRTQKLIAAGTWAAFIAATIYAGIASKQLGEMRKATTAAKDSADAAKKSADTASQTLLNSQTSFEIDQRPYMVTDVPEFAGNGLTPDKAIEANITLRNIGRSPARKYIANVNLLRFDGEKGERGRGKLIRFLTSSFAELESKDAKGRKLRNLGQNKILPPMEPSLAPILIRRL